MKKIWAHWFFAKQKHVSKAQKMAAEGLGSTIGLPVGVRRESP